MNPEFLEKMRERRREVIRDIAVLTTEKLQLDGALAALEGRPAGAPVAADGPTVTEMVLEAAKVFVELHKTSGLAVVFDKKNLKESAIGLFPAACEKIKTGVYGAVEKLVRDNKFKRTNGGFELA